MSKISNIILACSFTFSICLHANTSASKNITETYLSEPVFSNLGDRFERIRVKVGKGIKHISLSSNGPIDIEIHAGRRRNFTKSKDYKFKCKFSNKFKYRNALFATLSSNDFFHFDDKIFKGDMSIVTSSKDGCDLINTVEIDYYISTLLSKEMNKKWPIEALKAQAVAARSYAITKIRENHSSFFDLESSEKHQVSGTLEDISSRTYSAAMETKGLVLKDGAGNISPTFYHAFCGGELFLPSDIWKNEEVGYESKKCPYCHKSRRNRRAWRVTLGQKDLKRFLYKVDGSINLAKEVELYKEVENNMVFKVDKVLVDVRKSDFRRFFGRGQFKSNNFIFSMKGGKGHVTGRGNGHGVGMCQLGALEMAKQGFSFEHILNFYYPKLKIGRTSI